MECPECGKPWNTRTEHTKGNLGWFFKMWCNHCNKKLSWGIVNNENTIKELEKQHVA